MLWCNALLQIFVNMGKDIGHAITIAALGNLIFKGIVGAIVSCENIQNRKNKDALETTTNIAVDFWNFLILLMLMAFVFFPMKNSGLLQHQVGTEVKSEVCVIVVIVVCTRVLCCAVLCCIVCRGACLLYVM